MNVFKLFKCHRVVKLPSFPLSLLPQTEPCPENNLYIKRPTCMILGTYKH